jgi:hypothetical protein
MLVGSAVSAFGHYHHQQHIPKAQAQAVEADNLHGNACRPLYRVRSTADGWPRMVLIAARSHLTVISPPVRPCPSPRLVSAVLLPRAADIVCHGLFASGTTTAQMPESSGQPPCTEEESSVAFATHLPGSFRVQPGPRSVALATTISTPLDIRA